MSMATLGRERYRPARILGIPFGAKDLLSFAGHPTTWGVKAVCHASPPRYRDGVNQTGSLMSAHCFSGELSMVELAGGPGYRMAGASLQDPGLNPRDLTRWSSGSSSGPRHRRRRWTHSLRPWLGNLRLHLTPLGVLRRSPDYLAPPMVSSAASEPPAAVLDPAR